LIRQTVLPSVLYSIHRDISWKERFSCFYRVSYNSTMVAMHDKNVYNYNNGDRLASGDSGAAFSETTSGAGVAHSEN